MTSSHDIIMLPAISAMRKFDLWLEFEETEDREAPTNDFANILVTLNDGRKYGINVWTFSYLNTAQKEEGELYLVPPDLFVKELTRGCIEQTISQLLAEGELEDLLNNSIFSLNFIEPWWDIMETGDLGTGIKNELQKELHPGHLLFRRTFEVIAKRQDNDDALLQLDSGELALVHLTWSGKQEKAGYPSTTIYANPIEFGKKTMKRTIVEFQE